MLDGILSRLRLGIGNWLLFITILITLNLPL
jgi:hypothetical protein